MSNRQDKTLLISFLRGEAKVGRISTQTYEKLKNWLNDAYQRFDVTAELLADELLKNNIVLEHAYIILSSIEEQDLKTVSGAPATSSDIDRYNLYLSYLDIATEQGENPNDYSHKKDFVFEVFGYAWSHLRAQRKKV